MNQRTMEYIRQALGLEVDDASRDLDIINMSAMEQWRLYLQWEGIIGFEHSLHVAHTDIFGGTLSA